jgi:hypothetical protein
VVGGEQGQGKEFERQQRAIQNSKLEIQNV